MRGCPAERTAVPKKPDPAAEVKKTLDKTDRDINRAGVSGDKVLDALKQVFNERTRDES